MESKTSQNQLFLISQLSGTKNEPKPKLLTPDIFRWGRGLPRERVGAKKFDTPLETREIKLFGRDIPGFRRDIPELPEKFEKKTFGFNFRPLNCFDCFSTQSRTFWTAGAPGTHLGLFLPL